MVDKSRISGQKSVVSAASFKLNVENLRMKINFHFHYSYLLLS